MSIKVTIKTNWGNEAIYPACEVSKNFVKLTGRKTLTRFDISIIKNMGYSVEVMTPNL